MPSLPEFLRVTVAEASERLERAPGTIYSWGTRYGARKLTVAGRTYYDYWDLVVIERELRHGHPVPNTPEDRAAIRPRCPRQQPQHHAA